MDVNKSKWVCWDLNGLVMMCPGLFWVAQCLQYQALNRTVTLWKLSLLQARKILLYTMFVVTRFIYKISYRVDLMHPPLEDLLPRLPLPRPGTAPPAVSNGLSTPGTALFSGASSSTFSSSRLFRHAAFGFKFRSIQRKEDKVGLIVSLLIFTCMLHDKYDNI